MHTHSQTESQLAGGHMDVSNSERIGLTCICCNNYLLSNGHRRIDPWNGVQRGGPNEVITPAWIAVM